MTSSLDWGKLFMDDYSVSKNHENNAVLGSDCFIQSFVVILMPQIQLKSS